MTVRFLDLQAGYETVSGEIDAAVLRVLRSGWYIGGGEVAAFEAKFADYCGAAHCVGVGNGLDALRLALEAMGVGAGDEVLVSSNGFIATWLAVSMVGAVPVPVEPDPLTHNIDPARLEAALTDRTRVVLPTHLYGQPSDMDPILAFARERGLLVLEDAAQAHGARYKDRPIGAHGDAVTWSFYPSKNLGALGDAGAVTTNDPAIAERVRMLGNYGSRVRYVNEERGTNSRLDPLQAAALSVKLDHLDAWNDARRRIAAAYLDGLAGTGVQLPHVPNWADPCWHLFVIQSDRRDELQRHLDAAGIETLIHYPIPPHLQQAYASLGHARGAFPIAERMADTLLSLPIGPHLPMADVEKVIDAVRAFGR